MVADAADAWGSTVFARCMPMRTLIMPAPAPDTTINSTYLVAEAEDRYARHRLMTWWDQERVADATVLVAGAGAIGNEVIKLLALMGVHNLTIVDFDKIELTNLNRSVLFRDSDIGKSKALVAAARARELDPDSMSVGIEGDVEFDIGLGKYRETDVVIGCLDSINARLAVNRACLHAGTPWLNGGIEDVFGEVSLYAGSSPCFECGMTEAMWQTRNMRFSCGGQHITDQSDRMPTTATIASVIAGYLVNEAIMLIHSDCIGQKKGLHPGQKIVLSLMPYGFHLLELSRDPKCSAHELWSPVQKLTTEPNTITAHELLRLTDNMDGIVELGFDLLTGMICVECGQEQEILQPIEKSNATLITCPDCGHQTRRPTSISWIDANSPQAYIPLSTLCIPQHQIVAINGRSGRNYYQLGGDLAS
jgi:adenylyltransferase/sulfurtransferase